MAKSSSRPALIECKLLHYPPMHPPALPRPRPAAPSSSALPARRPLPCTGHAAAGPRGGVPRPWRRADTGPAGGAGRAAAVPGSHEHHNLCQPQVGWAGGRAGGRAGGWVRLCRLWAWEGWKAWCVQWRGTALAPLARPDCTAPVVSHSAAGKMKHYSSPREKKVLILGLTAMLSLPDAQVPAEIKPGMPQVRVGLAR